MGVVGASYCNPWRARLAMVDFGHGRLRPAMADRGWMALAGCRQHGRPLLAMIGWPTGTDVYMVGTGAIPHT